MSQTETVSSTANSNIENLQNTKTFLLDINFFLKDAERVEFYNGYDKRVEAPGGGGQIIPFLLKK